MALLVHYYFTIYLFNNLKEKNFSVPEILVPGTLTLQFYATDRCGLDLRFFTSYSSAPLVFYYEELHLQISFQYTVIFH